ncbi:MAG TPA: invasin domain 3-containing protein [Clostridia bacterium]|nr:invasin domain 3-containing protein [Clostridia bacterium]
MRLSEHWWNREYIRAIGKAAALLTVGDRTILMRVICRTYTGHIKEASGIKQIINGVVIMSHYFISSRTGALKYFAFILVMLLSAAIVLGFPISAAADGTRTGAWTAVSSGAPGEPDAPWDIAADLQGNVYVTDSGVIKKLPIGSNTWENVTQQGLSMTPDIITVDKNGTLYADQGGLNKFRKLAVGAAQWESIDNGGIFGSQGIAVDSNLDFYITNSDLITSDYYNTCIKLQNGIWTVIGRFRYIRDITADYEGNIYVTSQSAAGMGGRDEILKYSYGSWSLIGDVPENRPEQPGSIAVDKSGNVYVVCDKDRTLKVWTEGQWKTVAGESPEGPLMPTAVAVDGFDNVYVTDVSQKMIWKLQSPATKLVWLTRPGNGIAGRPFSQPPAVALMDAYGNVEVGDNTHTVTLSLSGGSGATMSGATAKLQNGIATFSNLTVNKVGSGYTLTPSCSLSAGLAVQSSNPFNMDTPGLPVVTGVSPASGLGGTSVTISGDNLTAASKVEFGTTAGVNLIVNSDESVTVTAPAQIAGTVSVTVTTPGGTSQNNPDARFTYRQPGAWTGAWTTIGNAGVFGRVTGIAVDSKGYVYVTDEDNKKLKRMDSYGWYDITPAIPAEQVFSRLVDVLVDGRNNADSPDIYIADYANRRIIKNGSVFADFKPVDNPLYDFPPMALDMDKNGNIYAAGNNRILKWSGGSWSEITNGGGFSGAQGIAVNGNGDVYVSDSYNNFVKKLAYGTSTWSNPIGTGLSGPTGIAVDALGNVYVADGSNNRIKELRIGADEWVVMGDTSDQYGYDLIMQPTGVAVDSLGNLYVTGSDKYWDAIVLKKQAPATQLVWQTQPADGYTGQDLEPFPTLALKDACGNTVTADSTDTVTLSLYSSNGAILEGTTTVTMVNGIAHFVDISISKAGSGYSLVPSCSLQGITVADSSSFNIIDSADPPQPPMAWAGGWTTIGDYFSGLSSYTSIAVDKDLTVYVADRNKDRLSYKINGSWTHGDAVLNMPSGVAVDDNGAVYVADYGNRRVLKDGVVLGGGLGFRPYDAAAGKNGNTEVYACGIDDGGNPFITIYKNNVWSDILYKGGFSRPTSITADGSGNVYVADDILKVIKKLPAGTSQWKTIGSGFSALYGIAADSSGNVYAADIGSGEIKVLRARGTEWVPITKSGTLSVRDVAVDKLGNVYATGGNDVYMHQAPATQLVWQTQPTGGMGREVWAQQPVVHLKDANGSIETGDSYNTVTVSLYPKNGATLNGTSDEVTVTLNNGAAAFSNLLVDKAGTYTLKLSSSLQGITCPQSGPFNITVGPVDGAVSEITANKTTVTADGTDSSTITVTLKDARGNLISGKTVELSKESGGTKLPLASATTDADGIAYFTVKNTKAEQVTYTATDTTDDLPILNNVKVSFVAGAINAAESTVEADKSVVTADDTDSAAITVTLKDANGNLISGKVVELSKEIGGTKLPLANATTDEGGIAYFNVKNTKAETVTYTVEAESVQLAGIQVTFKAGTAEKLIVSTPGTQTAGVPFDLTVTVQDYYGNIVKDYTRTVSFSTNNGNSPGNMAPVLPQNYSFTEADAGVHSFSSGVTLYNAAISAITATDTANGSVTGTTGAIAVEAGMFNAVQSTTTADVTTVTANGSDSSTITVAVKDAYGNPVSGRTVTLDKAGGSSVITTVQGVSQMDGTAVFTVKNTKAEKVTYTAKEDETVLGEAIEIDFVPGPAETLAISTIGTQTAGIPFSITVTAKDHHENTVTGFTGTVQLTSTDTAAVLPGSHTYAAADKGIYEFKGLILKTAGVQTVTAADETSGSVTGNTGNITVNAGSDYSGQSTAAADKSIVTADGEDSATITVTLKDDYGNLVGGKAVTLEEDGESSVVEAVYGTTRIDGTAVFIVTDTLAEHVTCTAKVNGAPAGEAIEIDFIPGPAETLVMSPVGSQTAGIPFDVTVTVKDHYGNTVTDYIGTVQLTGTDTAAVLPGSHTFTAGDGGVYEFKGITLKTSGIWIVTAVDTKNGSVTGTTGNITVAAGDVDAVRSEAAADNTVVIADGTAISTITVTIKDACGNVISGKAVTLDKDGGSSVVTTVHGISQADGTAVFTVKNTIAEKVTYTAKVHASAVGESIEIHFIPGPAETLAVNASGTQTAGTAFDMTVNVKDHCGNIADGYTGTVQLTSTDTAAVLPGSHTFTADDKGIYEFKGLILKTAGVQTVRASDIANGSITGNTGNITVKAGTDYAGKSTVVTDKSIVTADGKDSAAITVTLRDACGNPVSDKIITLEEDRGSSVVEAVYSTTRSDGTALFIATDTVAEVVAYSAKADGKTVNQTAVINFVPGEAETIIISSAGTQQAGIPFSLTVTVRDNCGNTVTGYTGTVKLTSTDTAAILPGSHTFTAADKGVYRFDGITLKTAGIQSITAVDTVKAFLSGTMGNITVEKGSAYEGQSTVAVNKTVVTANGTDSATITVTLRDAFGNPINGKKVTLKQGNGSSVIKTISGNSDIYGNAVFAVTSTKAENVTYTVAVNGKDMPSKTVSVSFIPGMAIKLVWKTQPGGGAVGQVWPQQPTLALMDAHDNIVKDNNSAIVAVALKNSNGAILEGTTEVTLKNGEAVFNNLGVDKRGSYTLAPAINLGGIALTDSNYFRISLIPAPNIEPGAGIYLNSVEVRIEYEPEYEAYYSLDGSNPTQDSVLYTGAFTVFSNCTVTAAVYDSVYGEWSPSSAAEFIIQLPAPTADPKGGSTVENNSTVKLSCAIKGVATHYTTDGSIPAVSSTSGNTVKITGAGGSAVTLKAYAVKAGYKDSEVAEFKYTIKHSPVDNDENDKTKPPASIPKTDNTPASPTTTISGGSISVAAPKLDGNTGKATTTVSSSTLTSAFNGAQTGADGVKTVELNISGVQGATAYEPTLPAGWLSAGAAGTAIKINTAIAAVTVPGNMLTAANAAGAQNVSLTIAAVDKTGLTADIQAQIGNRPVIELNLNIDSKRVSWSNETAPVTVSIPYTPTAEELQNPEHITVWYIDGSGNATAVPSGRYDPAVGTVTFNTTHFSKYAVVYVEKTFSDLGSHAWAKKQIEVLASKGVIINSGATFSPGTGITRADYLMMLVRALGLSADFTGNFDDIKYSDYYYRELGTARQLGITTGIGNNRFNPAAAISRQDMMVLTERALRSLKKISKAGSMADLEKFTDKDSIAAYAKGSMAALAKEGLIEGGGSNINPLAETTRAEAAVFVYRIYNIR